MADQLYLSLWFANFYFENMPATLACVVGQFPFARSHPSLTASTVYPLSWNEPQVFQRLYDTRREDYLAPFDVVIAEATEPLHEDYAYEFEARWDLWMPVDESSAEHKDGWEEHPSVVRITAFGPQFDEQVHVQNGHIRIDLGPDTPFLQEGLELDEKTLARIEENLQKLIDFTARIEKECNVASRLLWSEADDSLAQRLISRLQRLN